MGVCTGRQAHIVDGCSTVGAGGPREVSGCDRGDLSATGSGGALHSDVELRDFPPHEDSPFTGRQHAPRRDIFAMRIHTVGAVPVARARRRRNPGPRWPVLLQDHPLRPAALQARIGGPCRAGCVVGSGHGPGPRRAPDERAVPKAEPAGVSALHVDIPATLADRQQATFAQGMGRAPLTRRPDPRGFSGTSGRVNDA